VVVKSAKVPVQINGKVRARLRLPADAEPAAVQHAALQHPRVIELVSIVV
jgi:leucyl-tRNA synthetase